MRNRKLPSPQLVAAGVVLADASGRLSARGGRPALKYVNAGSIRRHSGLRGEPRSAELAEIGDRLPAHRTGSNRQPERKQRKHEAEAPWSNHSHLRIKLVRLLPRPVVVASLP